MNNRVVVVLDEDRYTTSTEPLLIVSIEPQRSSKGGNGHRKKRK